jgi:NitT/TauT family transport system ATP-binding protein
MQIILQDIRKAYGEKVVYNNLCLTFGIPGVYCLMAPSGFGKTTLLHILGGLAAPDSGSIAGLDGLRPCVVFQDDRLCRNLSAGANLRMVLESRRGTDAQCASLLEELGLGGCLRKPARELSGGMRRRLALGRALLYGGDIYLFDEPFSGLDHDARDMAAACIQKYTAGKTLVIATHDESDAQALGAEIVRLDM